MKERRLEVHALQDALKYLMQNRGLKLTDLSAKFSISIATAKRLLNGDDLSMDRVLEICDWLDVSFFDLVELIKKQRAEYHFCSTEQEEYLAKHPSHFAFLKALQRGLSISSIRKASQISKSDCDAYLADLESHQFLKIGSGQSVELIVKDGMDWLPNGPLWKAYYARWISEVATYMQCVETPNPQTLVEVSQRQFTPATIRELKNELDEISRKYATISRLERRIHPPEKLEFYTCLMLGDQWTAPMWTVKPYK